MATARDRCCTLATIAELRRLQSLAAEMEAVRAANAHRAAEERYEASLALLAKTETGWSEAMEGVVFSPDLARQWAARDQGGVALVPNGQAGQLREGSRQGLGHGSLCRSSRATDGSTEDSARGRRRS